MTPLQGKIALVTGGAGGIGSAISRRLAAGGASVVVTYSRSRERAEALVESLPGSGHRAVSYTHLTLPTTERV